MEALKGLVTGAEGGHALADLVDRTGHVGAETAREIDDAQHVRGGVLGEPHGRVTDRRAPRGRSTAGGGSARSRTA